MSLATSRQRKCVLKPSKNSKSLEHVPDHFKTQEMCIKAVEKETESLEHVPDHFKTREMCTMAYEIDLYTLIFCPDCFVTEEQTKWWYDDDYDDGAPDWYEDYQKRKAQKAKMKEELLPTAWHPSR